MQNFRDSIHFHEIDEDLVITKDPVGFERILADGSLENYMGKLEKERKR
jgi:hypothetical protein